MSKTHDVANESNAAFNANDFVTHRDLYDEHVNFTGPGGVQVTDRNAITDFALRWRIACPDGRVVVRTQVVQGDRVAEEFEFVGTHTETLTSPGGDVPPTGKQVTVRGAEFIVVRDGKIAVERVYLDEADIVAQFGRQV